MRLLLSLPISLPPSSLESVVASAWIEASGVVCDMEKDSHAS